MPCNLAEPRDGASAKEIKSSLSDKWKALLANKCGLEQSVYHTGSPRRRFPRSRLLPIVDSVTNIELLPAEDIYLGVWILRRKKRLMNCVCIPEMHISNETLIHVVSNWFYVDKILIQLEYKYILHQGRKCTRLVEFSCEFLYDRPTFALHFDKIDWHAFSLFVRFVLHATMNACNKWRGLFAPSCNRRSTKTLSFIDAFITLPWKVLKWRFINCTHYRPIVLHLPSVQ